MRKFWNLVEDTDAPGDGVLDIDGEIVAEKGWFTSDGAVVAKDFRAALKGVGNVTVHINSPGGDVMAGAEIYSALREHSLSGAGKVTVIVTALAASAASIVAMAGDEILMHPVAYMMIHNPWTMAVGDAKELRRAAKVLDVIGEGLISAYQTRTGKSRDELKKMLENETWMSAATCVAEGFADGIFGTKIEAAASLMRPTLMSAKAHGLREILERVGDDNGNPVMVLQDVPVADFLPWDEADPDEPDEEQEDSTEEEPDEEKEDESEEPDEEPDEEAKKRAEILKRAMMALASC